MKMTPIFAAAAAVVISTQALAHPTGIPYSTRGECEAAYAEFSKFDRERLSELGFTPGEAQRTFRDLFACQYDPNSRQWFIVLIGDL